jgi:hypothetical protein
MFSELYFLIEGTSDERFFQRIIEPIVRDRYDYIGYYQYAERPKSKIQKFIRSIVSKHADFFCMTDINASPCITARKQHIKEHKLGNIDDFRILVIKKEIESWYLAGLDEDCCRRLRLPLCRQTENINKEQFEQLLSDSRLGCTINCMIEILKNYNIGTAKSKNMSFDYFHRKYLDLPPISSGDEF